MQILARGHVSSHACVDMLNVIYTFSLLIEEASDIVLVCDCLFCGGLQLFFFFFAKTAWFWLMLCTVSVSVVCLFTGVEQMPHL